MAQNEMVLSVQQRAEVIVANALTAASYADPAGLRKVMVGAMMAASALRDMAPGLVTEALVRCLQIGLVPNTPRGFAYMIPFKGKNPKVEVIVGYKGYLELARRSGEIRTLHADVVMTGERLDMSSGSDGLEIQHHIDPARALSDISRKNAAERLVGAYAVCTTVSGARYAFWISLADVEARRKRGASGKGISTPWDTDYAAMARKSAVRGLFASGAAPMSEEIAMALESDNQAERAAEAAALSAAIVASQPRIPGGDVIDADEPEMDEPEAPEPPKVDRAAAIARRLSDLGWLADAETYVQREAATWTDADVDTVTAWARERKAAEQAAAETPVEAR